MKESRVTSRIEWREERKAWKHPGRDGWCLGRIWWDGIRIGENLLEVGQELLRDQLVELLGRDGFRRDLA